MSVAGNRIPATLAALVVVFAAITVIATPAHAEPTDAALGDPALTQDDAEDVDATADDSKERIAFISNRDTFPGGVDFPTEGLYTMAVDGTDLLRVTMTTPSYWGDNDPTWSPDGVWLAYRMHHGWLEAFGILGVTALGGEYEVLVPPGPPTNWNPAQPAWSPDGDRLAFHNSDDEYAESNFGWIWVLDQSTGATTRLLEGAEPTWSPDGSKLAFASHRSGKWEIWIVDRDGTNPTRLTTPSGTRSDGHPDWSPDGTRIAFHRADGCCMADVYVIDVDGSNERQLTTAPNGGREPAWSPDGTRIAYASTDDSFGRGGDIYVMGADGANVMNLTNHPAASDRAPTWRAAPDPINDVDMVVLGGAGVFDDRAIPTPDPNPMRRIPTWEFFVGAVSGTVAAQLDLMTTGTVSRLAGSDRYGTAVEISEAYFSPDVPVVYIATGGDYPDALTSGAAAGHQGGPVLLVASASIPGFVSRELERLAPQRIVVVGGTAVVSEAIASELAAYTTGTVTRLGGQDRYETAAAISSNVFSTGVDVAYVATGENFPDALPAAAAAGSLGGPLLLVQQDAIPLSTASELARLAPKRIVIAGEADVVSESVAAALGDYTAGPVERQAGPDRFATAAAISQAVRPGGASTVFIATGADFPDGVTASPAAITQDAPLLLVWTDFVPTFTRRELIRLGR